MSSHLQAETPARQEFAEYWRVILLAFIGVGLSVPVIPLYGFGLFMREIAASYHWSLARVSSGMSALSFSLALSGPVVGLLVDRYGAYRVFRLSTPLMALAFAGLAFVNGSIVLYELLWCVIGACGMGSSPILWTRLINLTFSHARGLALGIASCGAAAFLLLVKPPIAWLIQHQGWQVAAVVLGLLPLVALYPLALVPLRRMQADYLRGSKPVAEGPGMALAEALWSWRFFVMIVTSVCIAALAGLLPHLETLAVRGGARPEFAALVTSVMGASLLAGRLLAGFLSDRLWSPGVFAGFLVSGAAACLELSGGASSPRLLLASILTIGLTTGGEFQLLSYVTGRYFGVRIYATLFGIFYGVNLGVGGLWALGIGRGVDVTGGYRASMLVCAAALVFAAMLLCSLGRAPVWPLSRPGVGGAARPG